MSKLSIDKVRGALFGLALGDAFGQPLEFVKGKTLRRTLVNLERSCRPTDDTMMTVALARAVDDYVRDNHSLTDGKTQLTDFDSDAFGHAVGDRFIEWRRYYPGIAPGGTCMRGVSAYEQSGDWKTSGVKGSDGCGAVMRVAPIGIAFHYADRALLKAAAISSVVTHAHENAIDGTIAAAYILSVLLRTDGMTIDGAVAAALGNHGRSDTMTAEALLAAVKGDVADVMTPDGQSVDISKIPAGDGGWRTSSALGIAVAAVRYIEDQQARRGLTDSEAFYHLLHVSTKHDGDSDSTGAIAGMLWGAMHGFEAIPAELRSALDGAPRRENVQGDPVGRTLEHLAVTLVKHVDGA